MLENYSYSLVKFSIFTEKNDEDKFYNVFNFNPFK